MFHRHGCRTRHGVEDAFYAIGRHRGRGFGFLAGGMFGDEGMGGRGFRMGRKLGSTELQLLLLALLAEKPSHGYELIKALEERSGGFYIPSPGMIYPALTFLEEIGFATVVADGAKKLYSITDAGKAYFEKNRSTAETILAQLERIGKRMEHVRRAFAGDSAPEGEGEDGDLGSDEFRAARRDLRRAVYENRPASDEEAKRIAQILKRAADEIRGK